MPTPKPKSFRATLERTPSRLNWVIIRVPLAITKTWGTRGRIKVRGEINGFAFCSSLFPSKAGGHIMIVNKHMKVGAGVSAGAVAKFSMQVDTEERIVTLPPELKSAMAEDRSLRRWYEGLNYSTRKSVAGWVTEVKSAEARLRRAEQMAERLMLTMDAERELPPILQVAFADNPGAAEGWELMSSSRRRRHLFGIFYYRNPEGRARRVEKLIEDATQLAECKKK